MGGYANYAPVMGYERYELRESRRPVQTVT